MVAPRLQVALVGGNSRVIMKIFGMLPLTCLANVKPAAPLLISTNKTKQLDGLFGLNCGGVDQLDASEELTTRSQLAGSL